MEVTAIARNIRISPRKMRLLALAFKKTKALDTLTRLKYVNRAGSVPLSKVISSAMANARTVHNLPEESLQIKNILVDDALHYKRFRAVSRGSAHSYKKRGSTVTVVLEG